MSSPEDEPPAPSTPPPPVEADASTYHEESSSVSAATDTVEASDVNIKTETTPETGEEAPCEKAPVKSSKPTRTAHSKGVTTSTDTLRDDTPASKGTKQAKYANKIKMPASKGKCRGGALGGQASPQKHAKSNSGKSDSGKSSKKLKSQLCKSTKSKPTVNYTGKSKVSAPIRTKSKPVTMKSSRDWSAASQATKSSKMAASKVIRVISAKGRSLQGKSKGATGTGRGVKSKQHTKVGKAAAAATEKSSRERQASQDSTVELIKQIISEMQKSASSNLAQNSRITSRGSSGDSVGGSVVAPETQPKTAQQQRTATVKAKSNPVKSKTGKSSTSGKSCFSSSVAANGGKGKESKRTPTKRGGAKSTETSGPTAKVTPTELSKVNDITKQMKMDPKMAKALEKYWPELVTAFKQAQMSKEGGKAAPLTGGDTMTNDEMEDLNDELSDLNNSINTLRHSYGSIIRSLVNMQRRREKKKAALAPVPVADGADAQAPEGGGATAGPPPTVDEICAFKSIDYEAKYNMERFMDCNSRDGVFQELFSEVNQINGAMAPLKKFYNAEGYFQGKNYQEQEEWKLTRAQFTDCLKVIKSLSKVVTTILKAYNTDLLDMFRINSSG